MILKPQEIRELTGKGSKTCQKRELGFMGIPFRERMDGSPVVMRAAVEALFLPKQAKSEHYDVAP